LKICQKKDLTQRRKGTKAQRNYLASLHLGVFALKNSKFFCQEGTAKSYQYWITFATLSFFTFPYRKSKIESFFGKENRPEKAVLGVKI